MLSILPLIVLVLTACAAPSEVPTWFDSIQRVPVRTVLVQGHRIAYLDAGKGSPVILVHGIGGSMWQWEYQQAALSAAHRLITLDLPGSGLSDKPGIAYTPTEMVELFREFMDRVGVPRATLVGNSMGAGLAIGVALTYPDRVDRLVLISGFPDRVRDKLGSPMFRRAVDSRVPIWLVSLGNWFAGRGLTRDVLSEIVYDPKLLTPLVVERSYLNRKRPGLIPPMLTLMRNLPLWEDGFARQLTKVRPPTLIVWGAEDRVFPPKVGQDLHAAITGSSFTLVPEAGHIPQWERPDFVNRVLLNFLQP